MDRALWKLLGLKVRGLRRRMFRGVKTLRGGIFFALSVVLMVFWIAPSIFMAMTEEARSDPQSVRTYVPLGLLGICLMNVLFASRQKSLNFTPAEVDFLFPGPFTRQQLLIYKLSGSAAGAAFTAVVFSAIFLRHATLWVAALAGCFLAMLFVQLFSTSVVLIGQSVVERLRTRLRKLLLLAVAVVSAMAAWQVTMGGAELDTSQILPQFRDSLIGRSVLAPLGVFAETFAAERFFPDLILWGAAAALLDLAMLALVLRLDVNYMESALVASQKAYQRLQRARRGHVAWTGMQAEARWSVPRLPWLGGTGPIIRRQAITALRTARGLMVLLVIMAVVAVPMFPVLGESPNALIGPLTGNLIFLTILLTRMLPFDFRGDLDYLDWLKSLPLGSAAVATGQLVTPVVMMSALHLTILGGVAWIARDARPVLLSVALFVPLFNVLLFGLENLFFLLFPTRSVAAAPGDFQFFGRFMVEMFLKVIILAMCCGLAAALGSLVYFLFGHSWIAALAVAWLVLAAIAGAIVPCIAWAFRRFDVSLDTP